MYNFIRPALACFAMLTVVVGVVYPAIVTLVANVVFPAKATGSVVVRDGKAIGSSLIGQQFSDAKYFWPRPSAAGAAGYDGASGSGSNLGPNNLTLHAAVAGRVTAMRESGGGDPASTVPGDLVTASASGLDPHISPAAAEYQVARVARARGMREDDVRRVVCLHTEQRTFGVIGEPRVNVLASNGALDAPTTAMVGPGAAVDTVVGWRGRGFLPEAR